MRLVSRQIRKTSGFTLIELLIVITIVAVIVAVLLPALSSARAAAQSVQCMSNLRQLGMGSQAYSNDHNDQFPGPYGWFEQYPSSRTSIYGTGEGPSMLSYLGIKDDIFDYPTVYTCPTTYGLWPTNFQQRRTYIMNRYTEVKVATEAQFHDKYQLHERRQLSHPSDTVQFYDGSPQGISSSVGHKGYYLYSIDGNGYHVIDNSAFDRSWKYVHKKAVNTIYHDGHAKSITKHHAESQLSHLYFGSRHNNTEYGWFWGVYDIIPGWGG